PLPPDPARPVARARARAPAPAAAPGAASCNPAAAFEVMGCEIDMTDPVDPLWPCAVPGVTAMPTSNGAGLTLRIDMNAAPLASVPDGQWDILQVVGMTDGLWQYALNIGNSPSNDAWGGDANHTYYDAEAHLYGQTLSVWHSDMAGSGLAFQQSNALSSSGGFFEATVCDGSFTWESDTSPPTTVTHPDSIFQLREGDLDEDFYYVSFERVVWPQSSRTGSGIDPYPYLLFYAL
ncbi:MAG: hypothetical protein AAGF11_53755, partial [Myxococcota bacterium]